MAAYQVLGTDYLVTGSGRRWHVFARPVTVGDTAVAGPFATRKAAVLAATKLDGS